MQAGLGISLNIEGDNRLMRVFRTLPDTMRKKHVRRGVTKAARVIAREARDYAPVQTGLLRRSIGSKVKTYGGTIMGIVGPRAGMRQRVALVRKRKSRWLTGKRAVKTAAILGHHTEYRDPAKYAHLVEFGTGERYVGEGKGGKARRAKGKILFGRGRFWGKRVKGTVARPFLRPAFQRRQFDAFKIIEQEVIAGLKMEAVG